MTYPQVLDAVARLHVDLGFREAFFADRAAALAPLDLTSAERDALGRLDPETVVLIGRLADFHRFARIQDQLTWVDGALRPDLLARVSRYMRSTPPELLNRDEALAFCRYLEQEPAETPPYLGELARYERLRISLAWGLVAEPRAELFEFPIPRIIEALGEAGWPPSERSPMRLSFKKVPGIPAVLVRG